MEQDDYNFSSSGLSQVLWRLGSGITGCATHVSPTGMWVMLLLLIHMFFRGNFEIIVGRLGRSFLFRFCLLFIFLYVLWMPAHKVLYDWVIRGNYIGDGRTLTRNIFLVVALSLACVYCQWQWYQPGSIVRCPLQHFHRGEHMHPVNPAVVGRRGARPALPETVIVYALLSEDQRHIGVQTDPQAVTSDSRRVLYHRRRTRSGRVYAEVYRNT